MINLIKARKARKLTQDKLSKLLKVSRSTVAMWETGSSQPDNVTLSKLAVILNVSTDYLLGREEDVPSSTAGVRIPVLGNVAAGIPIEAITDILDYEEISRDMASGGEYFGLRIKGDSMAPRILDGDVVIVKKQNTAENGDVAVVLVNGSNATVKKIKLRPEGLMLIPLNPSYEPMFYSSQEIESLPISIIGVVVELRGKQF